MNITFFLNAEKVHLTDVSPTATLLDWLRDSRGLTGTKEGCNEGDCGACTVMITDDRGAKAQNACILFLPQLHGKSVRTVEGIAGPEGQLHPVQQAMIDHHGSQCGFCTPGFVVSMATAHLNGKTGYDDALAGNLCRCTGYAPIIRAAEAAAKESPPPWIRDTPAPISGPEISKAGHGPAMLGADSPPPAAMLPDSADELAALYTRFPEATLVAGATDVGLWVTKQLRTPEQMIFLNRCRDLQGIRITDTSIHIGAGVTMDRVLDMIKDHHPSYAEMIRRYGSGQVRAAATIGGNIANGSPIGDNPPALIALGATVRLRQGDTRREMLLEDFYIAYGKQDRLPGEFVEAVSIPRQDDHLKVYKLSKRFDQDISAVCGAFSILHKDGVVTSARIAFGGMAGIPQRAHHVESALTGTPWTAESLGKTRGAWEQDFAPLSDMRASATYRLSSARNMLERYFHDSQGTQSSVLEVAP